MWLFQAMDFNITIAMQMTLKFIAEPHLSPELWIHIDM